MSTILSNMSDYQVFISYNVATQQGSADALAGPLRTEGYKVFVCESSIPPGADWRFSIDNAINTSVVVFVLLNDTYSNSRECMSELHLANGLRLKQIKSKAPKILNIIPVLFKGFNPSSNPSIQNVLYNEKGTRHDGTLLTNGNPATLANLLRVARELLNPSPRVDIRSANPYVNSPGEPIDASLPTQHVVRDIKSRLSAAKGFIVKPEDLDPALAVKLETKDEQGRFVSPKNDFEILLERLSEQDSTLEVVSLPQSQFLVTIPDAIRKLASAIRSNLIVTEVDLKMNRLRDTDMMILCSSFSSCLNLRNLNLETNCISSAGIEIISDMMETHPSLSVLRIANQDVAINVEAERALVNALSHNIRITTLGYAFKRKGAVREHVLIDQYLLRNHGATKRNVAVEIPTEYPFPAVKNRQPVVEEQSVEEEEPDTSELTVRQARQWLTQQRENLIDSDYRDPIKKEPFNRKVVIPQRDFKNELRQSLSNDSPSTIGKYTDQLPIDRSPDVGKTFKSAILSGQVDAVHSLLQMGEMLDEAALPKVEVDPLESQEFSEHLIFSFPSGNPVGILELLVTDLIYRAQSERKALGSESKVLIPSVVTFHNNIFYTIPTPFPSVNIVVGQGSIKLSITMSSDAIVIGAVVLFAVHSITSVTGRFFQGIPFTTERQQVTGFAPTAPPPSTGRHVMISYAWSQSKQRVVQLTNRLKALGVITWRDEEGSDILPPLSQLGNVYYAMAQAIEMSSHAIIFVSRAYQNSENCLRELGYLMTKSNQTRLLFVRLENPDDFEPTGVLGLALGPEFFHQVYDDADVERVATALVTSILTEISSRLIDVPSERIYTTDSSNDSSHISHLKFLISVNQKSKLQNYTFTAQMQVNSSTDYFELTVTRKLGDTVKSLGREHITVYISESYTQRCKDSDPYNTNFWSSTTSPYLLSLEPSLSFSGWELDELPTLRFPTSQSIEHSDSRSVGLYCSPKSVFRDLSESDLQVVSAEDFFLCEIGRDIRAKELSSTFLNVQLLHFSMYVTLFCSDFRVRCLVKDNIRWQLADPQRSVFSFVFWMEKENGNPSPPSNGFIDVGSCQITCPYYSMDCTVECEENNWLRSSSVPLCIQHEDKSLDDFLSHESNYNSSHQLGARKKTNPASNMRSVTFIVARGKHQKREISVDLLIIPSKVNDETSSQTSARSSGPCHSTDEDGNQPKKHIMVSYAWGPNSKWKPLVNMFSDVLRNLYHLDIWRDEEGSSVVPKLSSFSTINRAMAAAVESSDYAIVFVSKHYSTSTNCMKEMEMIDSKRNRRDVERIYFIMLEKDYTPLSTPPISGPLFTATSGVFYWELYQDESGFEEQLKKVAKEIAEDILRQKEESMSRTPASLLLTSAPVHASVKTGKLK